MVWKETCAVEERMRLVIAVEAGEESMAAICRRFGVSRGVGYKWLGRYRREGVSGLSDRSRAPPRSAPFAACTAANDVWCIDFKGWFRTGDGARCEPTPASKKQPKRRPLPDHLPRE